MFIPKMSRILSPSEPSLCVPRAPPRTGRRDIVRILGPYNLGEIDKIDLVDINCSCRRVFVHFKRWYQHKFAQDFRTHLLKGGYFNMIYNTPWFWRVYASKSKLGRSM